MVIRGCSADSAGALETESALDLLKITNSVGFQKSMPRTKSTGPTTILFISRDAGSKSITGRGGGVVRHLFGGVLSPLRRHRAISQR